MCAREKNVNQSICYIKYIQFITTTAFGMIKYCVEYLKGNCRKLKQLNIGNTNNCVKKLNLLIDWQHNIMLRRRIVHF